MTRNTMKQDKTAIASFLTKILKKRTTGLQMNDDDLFEGVIAINGSYRIRGSNDASLDKDFSAKLDVNHKVFFMLKFFDGNFIGDSRQLEAFLDCVSTTIVKANGFRNPGCRDWVDFDHNCVIRVDFIPLPTSGDFPDNYSYHIAKVSDLQEMYNDFVDLYNEINTYTETQDPVTLSCYQRFMSLFSGLSTDNAQTITGWFNIRAGSHNELTHNLGYSANLQVHRNINIDLNNCSSNQRSCLQNEVSTAKFKAKTFRNPECKDMVFFSGKVKVEYAYGSPKVFDIVDWNSFNDFADFIQNHFPAIQNLVKGDSQVPQNLHAPLLLKSSDAIQPVDQLQQTKFYCPRLGLYS